jgi:hypothetical protein
LVIENSTKFVKTRLPLKRIGGGGFGRSFFQGEMLAFVTAVLLGMAGLDPFDADAQT